MVTANARPPGPNSGDAAVRCGRAGRNAALDQHEPRSREPRVQEFGIAEWKPARTDVASDQEGARVVDSF